MGSLSSRVDVVGGGGGTAGVPGRARRPGGLGDPGTPPEGRGWGWGRRREAGLGGLLPPGSGQKRTPPGWAGALRLSPAAVSPGSPPWGVGRLSVVGLAGPSPSQLGPGCGRVWGRPAAVLARGSGGLGPAPPAPARRGPRGPTAGLTPATPPATQPGACGRAGSLYKQALETAGLMTPGGRLNLRDRALGTKVPPGRGVWRLGDQHGGGSRTQTLGKDHPAQTWRGWGFWKHTPLPLPALSCFLAPCPRPHPCPLPPAREGSLWAGTGWPSLTLPFSLPCPPGSPWQPSR